MTVAAFLGSYVLISKVSIMDWLLSVNCCYCLVTKSCLTLCDPMDWSLPTPQSMGFPRQEWVAISFSRGYSQSMDWIQVSCLAGWFFTLSHLGSPQVNTDTYFYLKHMSLFFWGFSQTDKACHTSEGCKKYLSKSYKNNVFPTTKF